MSTIDTLTLPAPSVDSYLGHDNTLWAWLTTHDHKRIAILYTLGITFFFVLGGVAAAMIRLDLLEPSGLLDPETYNKSFTFHGVVMVWFFLIPSIPATLGNFLLPLMIGARDMAFPRVNLASWYLYMIGGLFTVAALVCGGVDTGWTFYTPYSTMFSNTNVYLVVVGVFVTGFSTIFTGINFLVTTHSLRTPGMRWFKLPLFVWAMYAVSLVMVLATPVLAMTLALIGLERGMGVGVFDPALGGDPL
ncbi:MAG TPA: cbb3-type cytochrome c oxidase subunit I, partial [Rhodanobacteraceae bacterium]|nr:cbb3-type cytochrome c oxidase subunit I [Rhodanobacteraceae bacterium]